MNLKSIIFIVATIFFIMMSGVTAPAPIAPDTKDHVPPLIDVGNTLPTVLNPVAPHVPETPDTKDHVPPLVDVGNTLPTIPNPVAPHVPETK
ncbi:uncharacterized protein LOC126833333 isoform X3 [Adelges cooleyi]|uniref:uncharacterized protein LOC126833333 isoform X3 n=1 Tax=Adelges cooleyi TaxID=133065 RepID=UPI002180561E|nr:uncharacterized protein LOC126833333 isoform X3 [Adelges cooleyi]